MVEPARIAILLTCFNRRDLTVGCLERLREQSLFREDDVFLVDDGCTDGTGDAVRALMPAAHVIQGTGSLFWNGGMRLAWETAAASPVPYDFYLWLNDDVTLEPGALDMLVADADAMVPRGGAVIVTGATLSSDGGQVTYGGQRRPDPAKPLRLNLVPPTGQPEPVVSVSGNIVLVSQAAFARLGNLSDRFVHIFGDLDYGLRGAAMGIPMFLASRPGGTCDQNDPAGSSMDPTLSRMERLRRRRKEERKLHARDWRVFVAIHGNGVVDQIKHAIAPYARILLAGPAKRDGKTPGAAA